MKKDQIEVLNIVQQVLKSVLISIAACDKTKTEALSTSLQAAATHPRIEPQARLMLLELAEGMGVVASVGKIRQ